MVAAALPPHAPGGPTPAADVPVLVLGGTTEARILASTLADRAIAATTSLAGRTSAPAAVRGAVRTGGFGGPAELAAWLVRHRTRVVVDATHPFAPRITRSAVDASTSAGIPLLVLRRPGWSPGVGDDWRRVPDLASAAVALPGVGRRALLTIGRQEVAAFADVVGVHHVVRTIEPPAGPLPADHEVLLDRGPYALADELELLDRHRIDVLVTKDSGGDATRAKLDAARERGVPVVVVDRPPDPPGLDVVADPGVAAGRVASLLASGDVRSTDA